MDRERHHELKREGLNEAGIAQRLWAAWGAVRILNQQLHHERTVNVFGTATVLAASLMNKMEDVTLPGIHEEESVSSWISEIIAQDERFGILVEPLPGLDVSRLTFDELVNAIREAMVGVPFEKAYFQNAVETVNTILSAGADVTIWTTGDVYGYKSQRMPGTLEQWQRVKGLEPLEEQYPEQMSIIAAEDKFSVLQDYMASIVRQHKKPIVVVDDKIQNVLRARTILQSIQADVDIRPVWDRQGDVNNGEFSSKKMPKDIHMSPEDFAAQHDVEIVHTISDLPSLLDADEMQHSAWLMDFDDVISDDSKRTSLQEQEVVNTILRLSQSY